MRRNAESSSSSPTPVRHAASLMPSSTRERKYKGVRLRKWGRWVSEIRLPNSRERIWLGSHGTPEKAARAFDAAYICLRGPGGRADALNFPDSPPPDVGRRTSDPQEVYAAAVSHANRAAAEAPSSEPAQANGGGAPVETETTAPVPADSEVPSPPAPSSLLLEVSNGGSFDWLANPPPLYSPTPTMLVESHAYLLPASQKAEADVDMKENESGSCPGLWCFDN